MPIADTTGPTTVHVFVLTLGYSRRGVGRGLRERARGRVAGGARACLCPLRGSPAGVAHGSQYLSIRYSERLAEAGAEPSVGSVGDSYDNALAETIIELYKAEIIHRRGPWRTLDAVGIRHAGMG
jgi:transposase InsO family protein